MGHSVHEAVNRPDRRNRIMRFVAFWMMTLAATAFAPMVATASDGRDPEAAGASAADDPDAWRFRAAAYGWLMSVSGNVAARGQTVDVDAGFFQLFQKSDTLGALMGYVEAGKGKVGVYADVVWTKLDFSRSMAAYRNPLPGLTLSVTADAALTYSTTIVEMGGTYELGRWGAGRRSFTAVDGLLGFRYWNSSADLTMDVIGSIDFAPLGFERSRGFAIARTGTIQWVDPLVGLRVRHQFTPAQEVFVRGDIGGFGLQGRFAWQAIAAYSYAWSLEGYQLAGVVGYRALGLNSVNGSGLSDSSFNVVLYGPIIGFSVRF